MEVQDFNESVTIYKKEFEPVFLRESEAFYQAEGERLIASCDAPEYLRRVSVLPLASLDSSDAKYAKAEERFDSERSRTQYYLSSQTEAPLIAVLEAHLLTPHLQTIIYMPSSGLDAMIDADKLQDLTRMYRLFATVPTGLPVLRKALKETIMRRGKEVNALEAVGDAEADNDGEAEEPVEDVKGKGKKKASAPAKGPAASRSAEVALQWVQSVLDLKDRFERLLKACFADDISVQTTVNEVRALPGKLWVRGLCFCGTVGFQVIHQQQQEVSRVYFSLHRREPS